ncbi:polymerase (DNA-directed), delta interacting protein 3 S homeolog [Xenopus laevis]|uniref:MGC82630 protein n=1 Tax=Xenopus laevis TaxID=8355 RepID=Q6GPT4_XENLA|nr:polymerase (DNA-directed), delta interacting protein 3 S homeolog [Xenopus laevis]AAH73024.1 MGC82630 protein [Xenopus laevis]
MNSRAGTGSNMRSRLQLPVSNRPVATSFQRTFDARQKIGVTDARMKLGVKDAREKLVSKDARFRITGKVQDAREMLNSRKQQGGENSKVMDARQKLSLKRSAPSLAPAVTSSSSTINLTKTIQIPQQKVNNSHLTQSLKGMRINVVNNKPTKQAHISLSHQLPSRLEDEDEEDEDLELSSIPAKQMKMTATNTLQKRALPITKVVQNDTYTAPVVPQTASPTAPLLRTKTLTNMSRTLVTKEDTAPLQLASTEPVLSPLEGTKMTVNNLHPRVTEEDIVELFCVCGALKRARLLSPGEAEVVFVRKDDAVGAYKKYNNRYLDGQPMKCNLHVNGSVITSDQPILLRLSDTPSATKKAEIRRSNTLSSSSAPNPPAEVDPDTILKALFKSSGSSAVVQPTAFKIKL